MKRVFSALAVILLVVACAVPVMAAEAYDFYRYDIQFLPDFEYNENAGSDYFFCDSFVPEGTYHIVGYVAELYPLVAMDFGVVDIVYDTYFPEDDIFSFEYECVVQLHVDNDFGDSIPVRFTLMSDSDVSIFSFYLAGVELFPASSDYFLSFIPVLDQSQVVLDSMGTLSALMSSGVQLISGNWYTVLLLALSLLGLGAVAIRKLKRS